MGDKITLKLDERELRGKKVGQIRRDGYTPGVVYGAGIEPLTIQAPYNVMAKAFQEAGKHTPVHLTIGNKKKIAMIKDVDVDPVKHRIRHVSFHAVKQNEPVVAEVPIRLVGEGESEAEKAGLVVLQALERIEVKALPMDLPEAIEVSIVDLKEAGERVTLAEATLPAGVEFVEHDSGHNDNPDEETQTVSDLVVASVYEPAALQAANEAAGGDAEAGDEAAVEAEQGEDTDQGSQATEDQPGGKAQDEPKQS